MLAIGSVGDSIKSRIVVHKYHGAVARTLRGHPLPDSSVEVDDTVLCGLGPALGVEGQQIGEDDLHFGVLSAHLGEQSVVGFDDVAGGLLAEEHIVGSQEHKDDVDLRLSVQPHGQVAVCCEIGCLRTRVAFVVLVNVGPSARAGL